MFWVRQRILAADVIHHLGFFRNAILEILPGYGLLQQNDIGVLANQFVYILIGRSG